MCSRCEKHKTNNMSTSRVPKNSPKVKVTDVTKPGLRSKGKAPAEMTMEQAIDYVPPDEDKPKADAAGIKDETTERELQPGSMSSILKAQQRARQPTSNHLELDPTQYLVSEGELLRLIGGSILVGVGVGWIAYKLWHRFKGVGEVLLEELEVPVADLG